MSYRVRRGKLLLLGVINFNNRNQNRFFLQSCESGIF
jgi:hypothetical protein